MDLKETAMAPMNGTIKRLVSDKGFGFILASDGNEYCVPRCGIPPQPAAKRRALPAVHQQAGQVPRIGIGRNVASSNSVRPPIPPGIFVTSTVPGPGPNTGSTGP
jgi:hypothetical protein